jgi:hypothetical protein
MFNPATGAVQAKPRLSDKIGLDGLTPQDQSGQGMPGMVPAAPVPGAGRMGSNQPPTLPPVFDAQQAPDPFEAQFQSQLSAAAGNPKLQQSIREEYSRSKMKYNEDQAKSAGFTDRMSEADPTIKQNQDAGTSYTQNALSHVPLFGNAMVSDEYQQLDQAQRNFINSQLRRESGAAISPSEFDNAKKQYFPQPGDSDAVLIQKEQNRQTAISAMQRASGAAYIQPKGQRATKAQQPAASAAPKMGDIDSGYVFKGGDPSKQSSWQKVK